MLSKPNLILFVVCALCFGCSQKPPQTPGISLVYGEIGGAGNLDGIGTAARFNHVGRAAVDSDGNIWVIGGEVSAPKIRKVTPNGEVSTLQVDDVFKGLSFPLKSYISGFEISSDDTFWIASENEHLIYAVRPGEQPQIIAGQQRQTGNRLGSQSLLNSPRELSVSADGQSVYFVDYRNHAVKKANSDATVSLVYQGAGQNYDWSTEQTVELTKKRPNPHTVVTHPNGSTYLIGEYRDYREKLEIFRAILKIDSDGHEVQRWVGDSMFSTSDPSNAQEAVLRNPKSLAVDNSGVIWITQSDGSILQLNQQGELSQFSRPRCRGSVECTNKTLDGHGYHRALKAIETNAAAPLFYSAYALFKVNEAGKIRSFAGSGLCADHRKRPQDGQCGYISSMAVPDAGQMWLFDGGQGLRQIDQSGETVSSTGKNITASWHPKLTQCLEAGDASKAFVDDNPQIAVMEVAEDGTRFATLYGGTMFSQDISGARTVITQSERNPAPCTTSLATFENIQDVAPARGGKALYILEDRSAAIYLMDLDTLETTLVIDGKSSEQLRSPSSITLDADGLLLIGDRNGIHRLSAAGELSQVINLNKGNSKCGGGIWPHYLTVDSTGNIWFASKYGSHRVFRLGNESGRLEVIAGSTLQHGNTTGELPGTFAKINSFKVHDDRVYVAAGAAIFEVSGFDELENSELLTSVEVESCQRG